MPSKVSKPELPDGEPKVAPRKAAPAAAKPAPKPAAKGAAKPARKPAAKAAAKPAPKPAAKAAAKPAAVNQPAKPAAKAAPKATAKAAAAKPVSKPTPKPAAAKPAPKPAAAQASPKPTAKATPAAPKPAAAASVPVARTAFDAETLAGIRGALVQQREELQRQLTEIEEVTFNSSQSEISGEVSYDEDFADSGSFTFEREKDLSIANNVSDLRSKIDRALHKIDDGTYGICESCGKPIEGPRLKALPHVTLCLKCKKAEERR
ncbi:MAG TPA: TraR/DksA C4-type zinc finger protein [Actinomycetota bacterium]|nr:TraR/DksA C4-type zinc finger protein [Actinomycetota bacterium]